jgi:hypothetical protein
MTNDGIASLNHLYKKEWENSADFIYWVSQLDHARKKLNLCRLGRGTKPNIIDGALP